MNKLFYSLRGLSIVFWLITSSHAFAEELSLDAVLESSDLVGRIIISASVLNEVHSKSEHIRCGVSYSGRVIVPIKGNGKKNEKLFFSSNKKLKTGGEYLLFIQNKNTINERKLKKCVKYNNNEMEIVLYMELKRDLHEIKAYKNSSMVVVYDNFMLNVPVELPVFKRKYQDCGNQIEGDACDILKLESFFYWDSMLQYLKRKIRTK